MVSYINNSYRDHINEEKLLKVLEAFSPKSTPFFILYRNEDLEYFKTIDPNITSIEEISKADESQFNEYTNYLIENYFIINDLLPLMIQHLSNLGIENIEKYIKLILTIIFKYLKSPDINFQDKVRFVLKDPVMAEVPITAICDIEIISTGKPKSTDTAIINKKTNKKPAVVLKLIHEFDYYDKSPFLSVFNENVKIITYSHTFEKVIRYNILECINKLFKIEDLDKETFLFDLEEKYKNNFINPFINQLAESLKKDLITFEKDLTNPIL